MQLFLNSIYAAVLGTCFISASAFALENSDIVSKSVSNTDDTNYWTPERLKNAKPLDIPLADETKIPPLSLPSAPHVEFKNEAPPTAHVPLTIQPLFKPNPESTHEFTTKDMGNARFPFTSSRLVPITADISYPYSAVGKLFFLTTSGVASSCTATVLDNRIIVTAGHCVHSGTNGLSGFYTQFKFIPAFRDGTAPYASWDFSFVATTKEWATGQGAVPNAADFGMLELKDQIVGGTLKNIGQVTGMLGYQTASLLSNHVNVLGYPCNLDSCQKIHQVTAQTAQAEAPNAVTLGSDMMGGSSGGPWIQNFGIPAIGQIGGSNPSANRIVGITSYAYKDSKMMVQGSSILNATFTNLLNTMCNHQPGNC